MKDGKKDLLAEIFKVRRPSSQPPQGTCDVVELLRIHDLEVRLARSTAKGSGWPWAGSRLHQVILLRSDGSIRHSKCSHRYQPQPSKKRRRKPSLLLVDRKDDPHHANQQFRLRSHRPPRGQLELDRRSPTGGQVRAPN